MNTTLAESERGAPLRAGLWTAQIALAMMFGLAGWMKSTLPIPELSSKMAWVSAVPGPLVRFIGAAELAAAAGLLLPALTRILPALTPIAGAGLTVLMVLAGAFHLSRGEAAVVPMNVVLGALAAFVAWGRFGKARIAPR